MASESKVELNRTDLEYVLQKELGPSFKVEHFTTKALTKPGDNYGSTILGIEVIHKENPNDSTKLLSLVAKLMPPSEFLRDAFRLGILFNKEVRTYALVRPQLNCLQEEKGFPENEVVDLFPRFYGARTNLQEDLSEEADDSAIILLENLKASGFQVRDRRKGLDLKHVELTVASLARFHAMTLALKIHKPDVFKETVLKACEKYSMGNKFDTEKLISTTVKCVGEIPECVPYLEEVEHTIREAFKEFVLSPPPSEPFATMLHNDFWVNNMLFKYNSSTGVTNYDPPVEMKFVDFQIVRYDSPVRDLLFFLFTSSENGLLDKYLDRLIALYHEVLLDCLSKLKCKTEKFCFEQFQRELDFYAPREFSHILFLLKIVSAENSEAQSLSDSDMNLFDTEGGEVYIEKVKSLVLTFKNRGWLKNKV